MRFGSVIEWIRTVPRRLGAERGIAVPMVLFMVLAAFAMASVAVVSSVNAQQGTNRDLDTKDSLAVAEAGAHEALLRYNSAAADQACVAPQTLSGGWCTPATGALSGGGTFTYWVRPTDGLIEVVSEGTRDGASRRIYLQAHSAAGQQPFVDFGVIGLNSIGLDANADITADTGTNGDITLLSNSELCGDAQVGVGRSILISGNAQHTCGVQLQGSLTLPSVNQGDVRTNNDNSNFFAATPIGGQANRVCWNGVNGDGQASANCGSRELVITHNSNLTLPSGNYSFCRLQLLQNAAIYIANGATIRIYFDSPEACGYGSGVKQLELDSNSQIRPNGTSSSVDVAMLFVGSETRSTTIDLASNTVAQGVCEQDFVIYAPRTDMVMKSNSYYCGALAAKTIHINSNSQITISTQAENFELPNAPPHYVIDKFVECGGVTTSTPNSSC
jgi:hypothetical protein